MNKAAIKQILTKEFGASQSEESSVYSISEDRRLVVTLEHGQGVVQVSRVTQVRFESDYIALTAEKDKHFIAPDCIFSLKGADPELDKSDKRLGF